MKQRITQWKKDCSGNILILAALGIFLLVGAGGAAIDLGKQQLVRQRLQQAADAAALAGASMPEDSTDDERKNTAHAAFKLNFPDTYMGVARPDPSVNLVAGRITVTANSSVPVIFVKTLGIMGPLPAVGQSVTQIKKGKRMLDLVLVLDNSGSMGLFSDVGNDPAFNLEANVMEASAACDAGMAALPADIFPPEHYTCRVHSTLCTLNNPQGLPCDVRQGSTGFTRLNALRSAATNLTNALMNPNPVGHRIAAISWDDLLMTPTQNFTSDAQVIKDYLLRMYGRAGTNSTVGLAAAKDMIDANARANATHVVVLMTDGSNSPKDLNENPANFNDDSRAICTSLKSATPPTLIFTIGFGRDMDGPNGPSIRQFLSDCATGPNGPGQPNENQYFFTAQNAAQLNAAFDSIVGTVARVRILQ